MTLHFDTLMITGLAMIPGGLLLGFLLCALLGALNWEMESLIGFVPGIIITIVGIAVFLVGLGQEL